MADKLFYSMGEVAEMFDVNTSLIRHWESQFSILRPKRNKKGNRLFSPEDVENLKMIYHLVKERGMTLEGAKKALRKAPSESGVDRDAELMERLQRIRALLVEVREDLKAGEGEIVTASDADMTDADAAADFAQLRAVAAEPRLFVREQFPDVLFEGFVTVHVGVVARSGQRHDVECLVERPQAQRAEDAEIFEVTAHDAAGLHAADVVHARVDRMSPPGERLQAAPGDVGLFRDADPHPFAGEHGAALQASEAAADDDYVELPLHVTPPFGPQFPAGSVCIPYSTCACPCARRVSPCPVRGRSGPARASR